jgi:hypothetical protein
LWQLGQQKETKHAAHTDADIAETVRVAGDVFKTL